MKFGLTDEEHRYIVNTVVLPLESLGASVWCYGSRARGDHKKFSDLDLMIEGVLGSEVEKKVGEIQEALVIGNFPYKVDIVLFNQFAESYKNKYQVEKIKF